MMSYVLVCVCVCGYSSLCDEVNLSLDARIYVKLWCRFRVVELSVMFLWTTVVRECKEELVYLYFCDFCSVSLFRR